MAYREQINLNYYTFTCTLKLSYQDNDSITEESKWALTSATAWVYMYVHLNISYLGWGLLVQSQLNDKKPSIPSFAISN